MNARVRNLLIETARKKQVIHYQELCNACELDLNMRQNPHDRKIIGNILGDISEFEHENNRPLLSSLVLSKSMEEGDGFYKLCEYLGITSNWKRLKQDGSFAVMEMNRCFDFWGDEENYKKYK